MTNSKDNIASFTATIQSYLSSSLSLSETTQQFSAIITQSSESNKDSLFSNFLASVFDLARSAPKPSYKDGSDTSENLEYLSKLVALCDSIRKSLDSPEQFALFGQKARGDFNHTPASPQKPEQATAWTNLNTFLALLWTLYSENEVPPAFNYSLYAIWSLRDTLETAQPAETLDALISGAACWVDIEASGVRIFRSEKVWKPSAKTGAPARAGPLLQDRLGDDEGSKVEGYSKERWQFWRERFIEIADQQDVSPATIETANAASKKMSEIQSEN